MPRRYRSRSKRKVSRRKKRVSRRKSRTKRKTRRTRRMRGGTLQAKAEAEAKAKALAMQQDAAESLSSLSSDPTAAAVLDKADDMEEDAQTEKDIQRKFSSKIGEQRMSTERDDTIAYIERADLEVHTVPKLRQMCHDMGYRTTGSKKDLVARLLLVPYHNDLNKMKARHRDEQGALTLQMAQEQSQTGTATDRDMGFESDSDMGTATDRDMGFESD